MAAAAEPWTATCGDILGAIDHLWPPISPSLNPVSVQLNCLAKAVLDMHHGRGRDAAAQRHALSSAPDAAGCYSVNMSLAGSRMGMRRSASGVPKDRWLKVRELIPHAPTFHPTFGRRPQLLLNVRELMQKLRAQPADEPTPAACAQPDAAAPAAAAPAPPPAHRAGAGLPQSASHRAPHHAWRGDNGGGGGNPLYEIRVDDNRIPAYVSVQREGDAGEAARSVQGHASALRQGLSPQ